MEVSFARERLGDDFTKQADALMSRYYHRTVANTDLPEYNFDWPLYRRIEDQGMLVCCTARVGLLLVGFNLYAVSEHPHHIGLRMADCDGIAVDMEYRGQGIGGRLYDFAEAYLYSIGVHKVIHRYRLCYGVDEPLFAKKGFRIVEHVYMKDL